MSSQQQFEQKINALSDAYETAKDAVHQFMSPDSSEMTTVLNVLGQFREIAYTALQNSIPVSKPLNDLDKLSLMASNNQDIRQSTTLIAAETDKRGGLITMGVDANTIQKIFLNQEDYYISLYIINKKQFNSY